MAVDPTMRTWSISRLGLSGVAVSSAVEVVAGLVVTVAAAVVSVGASVVAVASVVECVVVALTLNLLVDPRRKRRPDA